MTTHHQHRHIPAMGHAALTPLYDPFVRVVARERTFKGRLIARLGLRPGDRVLDVGCGTGTLAVMIKRRYPDVEVTGIDSDGDVLERARRKASEAGAQATFQKAMATELPFADTFFERVTSTLMAHHLASVDKARMFGEMRRVLTVNGELHLVDLGPARSEVGRTLQRITSRTMLGDNLAGRLPSMMQSVGFAEVVEEDRVLTALGPLVFWRGKRND